MSGATAAAFAAAVTTAAVKAATALEVVVSRAVLAMQMFVHVALAVAMATVRCHAHEEAESSNKSEAVQIVCVGDSITHGSLASAQARSYPARLQALLDDIHGAGRFNVTNLGAEGAGMLQHGSDPYWGRPEFLTLARGQWDIVIIMLGTNDAKDKGDGGDDNWEDNCGTADMPNLPDCTFATDYKNMIELVRSLGTTDLPPHVYMLIPPPLMHRSAYGINQTIINTVFPRLIPAIQKANSVLGPIDVFTGLGGVADWAKRFPSKCMHNTGDAWPPCSWFCNFQSCDQCHPNDVGYQVLAEVVLHGLGLHKVKSTPTTTEVNFVYSRDLLA